MDRQTNTFTISDFTESGENKITRQDIINFPFPYKLWLFANLDQDVLRWDCDGTVVLLNLELLAGYLNSKTTIFNVENCSAFLEHLRLFQFERLIVTSEPKNILQYKNINFIRYRRDLLAKICLQNMDADQPSTLPDHLRAQHEIMPGDGCSMKLGTMSRMILDFQSKTRALQEQIEALNKHADSNTAYGGVQALSMSHYKEKLQVTDLPADIFENPLESATNMSTDASPEYGGYYCACSKQALIRFFGGYPPTYDGSIRLKKSAAKLESTNSLNPHTNTYVPAVEQYNEEQPLSQYNDDVVFENGNDFYTITQLDTSPKAFISDVERRNEEQPAPQKKDRKIFAYVSSLLTKTPLDIWSNLGPISEQRNANTDENYTNTQLYTPPSAFISDVKRRHDKQPVPLNEGCKVFACEYFPPKSPLHFWSTLEPNSEERIESGNENYTNTQLYTPPNAFISGMEGGNEEQTVPQNKGCRVYAYATSISTQSPHHFWSTFEPISKQRNESTHNNFIDIELNTPPNAFISEVGQSNEEQSVSQNEDCKVSAFASISPMQTSFDVSILDTYLEYGGNNGNSLNCSTAAINPPKNSSIPDMKQRNEEQPFSQNEDCKVSAFASISPMQTSFDVSILDTYLEYGGNNGNSLNCSTTAINPPKNSSIPDMKQRNEEQPFSQNEDCEVSAYVSNQPLETSFDFSSILDKIFKQGNNNDKSLNYTTAAINPPKKSSNSGMEQSNKKRPLSQTSIDLSSVLEPTSEPDDDDESNENYISTLNENSSDRDDDISMDEFIDLSQNEDSEVSTFATNSPMQTSLDLSSGLQPTSEPDNNYESNQNGAADEYSSDSDSEFCMDKYIIFKDKRSFEPEMNTGQPSTSRNSSPGMPLLEWQSQMMKTILTDIDRDTRLDRIRM